jgi:hypothetical protein
VGRNDILKTEDIGGKARRSKSPFRLLVENNDEEQTYIVDIVLDASGTYGNHNYLGPGGIPALGESKLSKDIVYTIPNPLQDVERYADKTTLVVGSGHSAITAISLLLQFKVRF